MRLSTIYTGIILMLLVAINWLAFHDLFEVHTARDYLTLFVSVLVGAYMVRAEYMRHGAQLLFAWNRE